MTTTTNKVHSWMPRFPDVVCRDCGADAKVVEGDAVSVACPLCEAAAGAPCTTAPKSDDDKPHQTTPHAKRQRAAGVVCKGAAS
jgi:hypothetical protein